MTEINILRKGDEVMAINERFLAVRKKNGEVEIYDVYFTDSGITIDPIRSAVIGFGNGTVETEEKGIKIINY